MFQKSDISFMDTFMSLTLFDRLSNKNKSIIMKLIAEFLLLGGHPCI